MFDRFARFRTEALRHLDGICDFARTHKYEAFARNTQAFQDSLRQAKYNIAVIGHMKRGKSTLINALLGRQDDLISPIDVKVCTAGIVQYFDVGHEAGGEYCHVYFHESSEPTKITFSQLADFVREERNPRNRKNVRLVEVFGRFPLLNAAVTLVDTPGRGATKKDHEALVDEFLPNADAIILPISADLPIERAERDFLETIREYDKDRIFFVLTKCDEVDRESLVEVEEYVQRQATEAGLVCRRLHKVSARELYEARARRCPADQVEAIRERCGMQQLERDLEDFILATSQNNDVLQRKARPVIEGIYAFCRHELARLDGEIEGFSRDVLSLEAELREVQSAAARLRTERDKALKTFTRRWQQEVVRFQQGLVRRADQISDGIISRLRDRGIVQTVTSSVRMGQVVAQRVDAEVMPLVLELEEKLSEAIHRLNEEVNGELSTYLRRSRVGNWGGSVGALMGVGAVLGVGTAGASTVLGVWGSAAAAWAAYGSQVSVAGQAAANVGVLQGFWAWLLGAGATNVTAGAAAAQAAQAAAFSSAMAATVGSIATGGAAIAAIWITKYIAHWGLTALQEDRVPALVTAALTQVGEKVGEKLEQRRMTLVADYTQLVDEMMATQEGRRVDILDAIKSNDPAFRATLFHQKEKFEKFLSDNSILERQLSALPQPVQ